MSEKREMMRLATDVCGLMRMAMNIPKEKSRIYAVYHIKNVLAGLL
jgi:hypothetical protein